MALRRELLPTLSGGLLPYPPRGDCLEALWEDGPASSRVPTIALAPSLPSPAPTLWVARAVEGRQRPALSAPTEDARRAHGVLSCRTQPQGPACPPPQRSPCPGNHRHRVGPPPPATRAKGRGTHRPRQPPGTPDTLALPHDRRSSCRSPGPAEPSGLLRAPHPPAVGAAPACAGMGPAAGGRGSGSRRVLYLSLLSRGREFSASGAPPRPPPPPLLLNRLASSSSRCWDLRGPSQPPRPVWGPVQPHVPDQPRPIRSGPAPAPPLGGDAPSSSRAQLDRGGEAGGRVGRGPLCPFLQRDWDPALPT